MSDVVDTTNARTPEYFETLREIQREGKCPFCPENFRWHPHPIIFSDGGWRLTPNAHPYENAEHHFLIIPDRHMEHLWNVRPKDWDTLRKLELRAERRFGFSGGALAVRFGSSELSGATVRHVHFHLVVPQIDLGTLRARPVYFPIG